MRTLIAALGLALVTACSAPTNDDVVAGDQALDVNESSFPDRTAQKRALAPDLETKRLVFTKAVSLGLYGTENIGSVRALTSTVRCNVFGLREGTSVPAGATFTFGDPLVFDGAKEVGGPYDDRAEKWTVSVDLAGGPDAKGLSVTCWSRWDFPTVANITRALARGGETVGVVARVEDLPKSDAIPSR
jgi:hypothetical protein